MADRILTVECVFATLVPDDALGAAVMYWARGVEGYGPRLTLINYEVGQLTPKFWDNIVNYLDDLVSLRRARRGSLGIYVESEVLCQHAASLGHPVQPILEHLTKTEAWPGLVAVAMSHVRNSELGIPEELIDRVKDGRSGMPAQFLTYRGGPRPDEDATVPAFLYGIVLGLDAGAAVPPRVAKVKVVA